MALEVLFEDDHLIAVAKPAGMVSHPCYRHADGTLFDALREYLHGTSAHPRLLQRLDKDTSGVVLVSKSMAAHAGVVRAMGRRDLTKEYLAIVHGVPDPPSGGIELRLRRDPTDTRRVAASETEGKESVTRFSVMTAGRADEAEGRRVSLVLCSPVTGRMHQIRVHLAARGWPIVGDPVYGPGGDTDAWIARQALHAWRVTLGHPVTRAPLVVVARVPEDFRAAAERFGLGLECLDEPAPPQRGNR